MKRVLLLAILAFGLFASAQDEPIRIGAAVYGLQAEYMQLWTTALERHPAVLDGSVEVTVFDGRYDASVQFGQFETMVSQGFDGIIFVPIDIEAGAAAVDAAVAAGIPVVGSNTRVNSDQLLSYVGSNDVLAGRLQAEGVIDLMGGSGNVVILEGPLGQSAQIERREGNLEAIEAAEGINILEMQTANWSRAESLDRMENWLVAHGGEIDGVIGQNDEMALGAIQALQARGMDPAMMPTSGIDGISDALLAVKDGSLNFSLLQDARGQAEGSLDVLLRGIIGESYEPQGQLWTQYEDLDWAGGTGDVYNVPWTFITPDNVDALLEERDSLTRR
ncbi:MAG: substrate-binding domain-containing protein [Deinococcota bacterium]